MEWWHQTMTIHSSNATKQSVICTMMDGCMHQWRCFSIDKHTTIQWQQFNNNESIDWLMHCCDNGQYYSNDYNNTIVKHSYAPPMSWWRCFWQGIWWQPITTDRWMHCDNGKNYSNDYNDTIVKHSYATPLSQWRCLSIDKRINWIIKQSVDDDHGSIDSVHCGGW